jgi:hypothetical protein
VGIAFLEFVGRNACEFIGLIVTTEPYRFMVSEQLAAVGMSDLAFNFIPILNEPRKEHNFSARRMCRLPSPTSCCVCAKNALLSKLPEIGPVQLK